ncbi:oxidoreductase [Nocardioides mangrovicus]|uniref:Oxidoreductase n=1 Tax=Nocardioides mangrovicus TaxID=2478913 RepID=A0A3L8P2A4_9ACTN|nr:PDR/VanB family oxidoreductase [Nocardioides mangrovicus]RLV48538.1 oxidoreductase [Nocardioides mangrovicus]
MAVESTVRWGTATVADVEAVADGVRRVVLEPDEPVHARPGTHVDLRLSNGTRTLTRSYSVVRSDDGGRRLTLTVALSPASRGGSRRMHALEPGERLAVTAPLQSFPLGVGAPRYVLLAGGIGLTALLAMAETLRSRGADYRLVVVGRSRATMPYLAELAATHGDRLELHVDDDGTGLDVQALVADVAARPGRTELYQCGPIGLMDAVRRAWRAAGLPAVDLRFETFGNSGSWEAQELVVEVPRLSREVRVPADTTLLDALEEAGVPVLSDCRKGECGLCVVRLLEVSGRVDHRDVFLDDDQKAADDRLCVCVSRAAVPPGEGVSGTARVVVDVR